LYEIWIPHYLDVLWHYMPGDETVRVHAGGFCFISDKFLSTASN